MKSIGLTGGLGSGKSTALKVFYDLGANILDADNIAKHLLQSDPELGKRVREIFGDDCYMDGELQNAVLAERAFSSPENQRQLNELVHPRVRRQVETYLKACRSLPGVIIIEAALLFEAGFQDVVDISVLVTADEDTRIRRSRMRKRQSESDIRRRMALQMPESEKRRLADHVIENNGDEAELRKACEALWKKITDRV